MNESNQKAYQTLMDRKSVRLFEDRPVDETIKSALFQAAFQAPTAGNQMLYTILDVTDPELKNRLAVTCDNQPFIGKAPLVFIFLAECNRWDKAYKEAGLNPRKPGVGDFLLAVQDAVIAAQNMVVAAELFGLGSCYIGDILENREEHRRLLHLEENVVPISMLAMGYPTEQQKQRTKPKRFEAQYIVQENHYQPLEGKEIREMFALQRENEDGDDSYETFMEKFWKRKYESEFALEMNRSSEDYVKYFLS